MAGERGLTELEGCVLGTIRALGPCTGYRVRREFLSSTPPYWSGSAGAIYPLIARLHRRRLIRVLRPTGDRRGGMLYTLTAAGGRALLRWLGPPLSPLTVGAPPDPIRTRVGFLGLLSPTARRAFLIEAADKLRHQLAVLSAAAKSVETKLFDHLALRGSYLVMEARLTWVREMAEALGVPIPSE